MKRWIQRGVAAVLASSVVSLSPWVNRVLALTQPEIIQKLQTVPVFILADNDGNMVPLSIFDGDVQDSQSFLGIFISQSDAQDTLATLQEESSDANRLSAIPVPLGDAYNMIVNSQQLEDIPPFAFIPQTTQLELAAQVLQSQGEEVNLTPLTVPLFHLSSTADDSYITVSMGESDRESIPLFFDGSEAQFLLNLLEEQANANNDPPPTIELRVAFLHQWLQIFETNNEDALQLVELIPIPESQALIANLLNQLRQQQAQPLPAQPSTQPPTEQPLPNPPSAESLQPPSEPIPTEDEPVVAPSESNAAPETPETPETEAAPLLESPIEGDPIESDTSDATLPAPALPEEAMQDVEAAEDAVEADVEDDATEAVSDDLENE